MPRFRTAPVLPQPEGGVAAAHSEEGAPVEGVRWLAAEVFRSVHFFVGPVLRVEWEHVEAEESVWEVFRGRLLDPAHSRQRRVFEAWNLYQWGEEGRAAEPLLSLKLDFDAGELHVVRGLDRYVWEGYDAGGNVYLSRERRKWVRELAATLDLGRFRDLEELGDELVCRLFLAVVGSSRLPLASIEAPLPAFSFGELFYSYRPGAPDTGGPLRSVEELVDEMFGPHLAWLERAKWLETFLHALPAEDPGPAVERFVRRWSALGQTSADLVALLRTLFNEVSLSPFTDLTAKTLAFVRTLEEGGCLTAEQAADFLGHLLRQLGRHLTAYDLVTFHHRGANYPDALLLDAVLKSYLALIERRPDLFAGADTAARLRRRALRQGWLLRRRYEGHRVPDLPTSPGENSRVLPPSHPRVAEEQILQPGRRTARLFAGDPLPAHLGAHGEEVLRQSLADLEHPEERRELGLALFLDRPFGDGKAPGEPDGTLLLATEAFSRAVAWERLEALRRGLDLAEADVRRWRDLLDVPGLPLDAVGGAARPGTVALADARQASPDFVFLRLTPGSVRALLRQYDFTPLAQRFDLGYLAPGRTVLLARAATGTSLLVYDGTYRPRLELEVQRRGGYESRAGQEYPREGLRVVRVWDLAGDGNLVCRDLHDEWVRVLPQASNPGGNV